VAAHGGGNLSQYHVGAQTRRTDNLVWHGEDVPQIHPHDADERGLHDGDLVRLQSRASATTLHARVADRVAPGVVYTTLHHPMTQATVVTTENADCPEYKLAAVQVTPSNGRSEWQDRYRSYHGASPRVAPLDAAE